MTLDLTAVANQAASAPGGGSRIDSVEVVDLTGSGNNTLKLNLADLFDMGSFNTFAATGRQQLMVKGDAGDELVLSDTAAHWVSGGTATLQGASYEVLNHATALATLYVKADVHTQFIL